MLETSTTQSDMSRLSGVSQPSISGFLSGRVDLSDDLLDRLLSCMGFRREVVRRPIVPKLTRSERRSWQLYRQLSTLLNHESFEKWGPHAGRGVGASPGHIGTALAQQSLRGVLSFCNARQMTASECYVSMRPGLIRDDGEVTDDSTRDFLANFIQEFRLHTERVLTVIPRS